MEFALSECCVVLSFSKCAPARTHTGGGRRGRVARRRAGHTTAASPTTAACLLPGCCWLGRSELAASNQHNSGWRRLTSQSAALFFQSPILAAAVAAMLEAVAAASWFSRVRARARQTDSRRLIRAVASPQLVVVAVAVVGAACERAPCAHCSIESTDADENSQKSV